MKKKRSAAIALTLAVYFLFLLALTAAEAPYPDSGIRSFADALWYSLVTITTVGYGDLYPLSPAGKAIGSFFLLLSVGALAFAVSLFYAMLTGRFIPRIRLFLGRSRHWYVFAQLNEASAALAADIARTVPDSLLVFYRCGDGAQAPRNLPAVCLQEDMADARLAGGKTRTAFFMSDDPQQNCDEALAVSEGTNPPVMLYCMGTENSVLPGAGFFDPFDCCARQYWQTHPICPQEQIVVIAGSGAYAQALLSQALLINCRAPFAASAYHLFGEWDAYRRCHPLLCSALEPRTDDAVQDAIIFHDDPWNSDAALLERADRIIFCADDEAENARSAALLAQLYPHRAAVHVRCASRCVSGTRFGLPQEIYTAELIMKHALDRAAIAMHEAYRKDAGSGAPAWEALSSFLKASNRASADHALTKVRLLLPDENIQTAAPDACRRTHEAYLAGGIALRDRCRENEHERWMRFHLFYNWQYAPQRDNALRRHPSLVPFSALSETEKAKDDHAWQQLAQLPACARSQEDL